MTHRPHNPTPTAARASGTCPYSLSDRVDALRAFLRRTWLYFVWYAMGSVAVAAIWAQTQSREQVLTAVIAAIAYLMACAVALLVPGWLLLELAQAAHLKPVHQRDSLHAYLIVSVALIVATAGGGHLWATTIAILLAGNAIWVLDAVDSRRRQAIPVESPAGERRRA